MFNLLVNINTSDGDLSVDGKQSCFQDNHLAFCRFNEMGKPPRQSIARIVKQSVYGANERVVIVINVVLVGLPAIVGCCCVKPTY